jgi:hypothetical protein
VLTAPIVKESRISDTGMVKDEGVTDLGFCSVLVCCSNFGRSDVGWLMALIDLTWIEPRALQTRRWSSLNKIRPRVVDSGHHSYCRTFLLSILRLLLSPT